MISITTQETKQSTVCEGVSFTVRKLSRIQRSERDLKIFEHRLKADDLTSRYWKLMGQKEVAEKAEPQDPKLLAELSNEISLVDYEFTFLKGAHLVPAVIRAGLVSIDGIDIDGKPLTPESLVSSATPELDDLVIEIYTECEAASGLSSGQRKNSQSPTTSPGQVTGEGTNSTADIVSD